MADGSDERSEKPTERRREEARKEGNFALSRELSSFFVILGAMGILYFSGVWMATGLAELLRKSMIVRVGEFTAESATETFMAFGARFIVIVMPALAIPLVGALAYAVQSGFTFVGKPLAPDFTKIDPVGGLKRLFSLNSIAELVKSIIKISILGYVIYRAVADETANLPFLVGMDVRSIVEYTASVSFGIMMKTAWVIALVAGLDYAYQRWTFEKGLRMTRDEIRQEMKELEGDPMIKARIKSLQREMSRKRMMQDVPKADVVVTNPTHLAIALKYDSSKSSAPVVVAKGAGIIAEKIREVAREHGVPLVENKPLAQALFKYVEIGKEIPSNLYKAVAELLAYVYRLKGRTRRR